MGILKKLLPLVKWLKNMDVHSFTTNIVSASIVYYEGNDEAKRLNF